MAATDADHGGAAAPVNGWAVASLVTSFVFPVGGLVLGVVGLEQISRTGERGRWAAVTGVLVSTLGLALTAAVLIVTVVVAPVVALVENGSSVWLSDDVAVASPTENRATETFLTVEDDLSLARQFGVPLPGPQDEWPGTAEELLLPGDAVQVCYTPDTRQSRLWGTFDGLAFTWQDGQLRTVDGVPRCRDVGLLPGPRLTSWMPAADADTPITA